MLWVVLDCLLDCFLLLKPVVKISEKQVSCELIFSMVNLKVQRHIVWSDEEVANIAERIPFMLLYQYLSPSNDVNIKSPNWSLRLRGNLKHTTGFVVVWRHISS